MDWLDNLKGCTVGLEITHDISVKAAELRAEHNIRTPDALQMSAALKVGATHFITNDIRLPELTTIQIISLEQLINPVKD